jgi:GxxExxY protein
MEVSNELGGGFLESVYEKVLLMVLAENGIEAQAQVPLEVRFRGEVVGEFQPDVVVAEKVIVEIKAGRSLLPEHEAQLLNYLRATEIEVGLLVNFGRQRLEWKRLVC